MRETQTGGILILHVQEERLTGPTAPVLQAHLIHRILSGHRRLVIDLAAVQAVDADGLHAIRAACHAAGRQGDVVLCNVTEPVMATLRRVLMNQVFGIFLGPEEAVEALT